MKKKILAAGIIALILGANALIVPNIFADKTPENREVNVEKGNKLIYDPLFDVDNISYSRNYYEGEMDRIPKMNYEYYYNDVKPTKTLDERTEEDGLYFDKEKNTVVLPDRELTDDELLAISEFHEDVNTLFEKNRPHPTEDMITSEEAEERAKAEVKKTYGADIKKFNVESAYDDNEETGKVYSILFTPINEPYLDEEKIPYYVYIVDIDPYTGKTLSVDYWYSGRKSD